MPDEEVQEDPSMSLPDKVSKPRLASDEFTRMNAAFERVKEFPEFKPNERAHWLELRQAVEMYLRRWG